MKKLVYFKLWVESLTHKDNITHFVGEHGHEVLSLVVENLTDGTIRAHSALISDALTACNQRHVMFSVTVVCLTTSSTPGGVSTFNGADSFKVPSKRRGDRTGRDNIKPLDEIMARWVMLATPHLITP